MNPTWSDLFRRNAAYKILSLAIAVLLYLVASAQNNPRSSGTATVRATFLRLPNRLAEPPDAAATLSVRLVGPPPLHEAARAGLRAVVDASEAKPGRNRLPVRFVLPPGVEGAIEVDAPALADFVLENKFERDISVDVWFDQTNPPAGYEYGATVVRPERCTVAGLKRAVERVARVVARLDGGTSVVGPIDREVGVVALDDGGKEVVGVEIRPTRVRFKQTLQRVAATRNLVLNPVFRGQPAAGFRLAGYRFEPPTVGVRGNVTALTTLTSIDIAVDVEGLEAQTSRSVGIELPRGVQRIDQSPIRIIVNIQPETASLSTKTRTGPDETATGNQTTPPRVPAP